jgi:hypothetical protein
MKVEEIPVDQIQPNPWNPSAMTGRMLEAARQSIENYGFVLPCLVRPHPDGFEIVDGEHRWRVALQIGRGTMPCVVADLDDATAKKLTVLLGEIEGEADPVKLGRVLAELELDEHFRDGLPYTAQELDALLAFSPDSMDKAGSGDEEWRTLSAQIPRSFLGVFQACEDRVAAMLAEEGKALHPKKPVRRGQVLEVMAAHFLASG